jgi:hypothetical protein
VRYNLAAMAGRAGDVQRATLKSSALAVLVRCTGCPTRLRTLLEGKLSLPDMLLEHVSLNRLFHGVNLGSLPAQT